MPDLLKKSFIYKKFSFILISQIHFDEAHSKEDQAFVQSLKDLFGKAKKILAEDTPTGAENLPGPRLKLAPEDDKFHPVSGVILITKIRCTLKIKINYIFSLQLVSGINRDLYPELDPTEALPSKSHFSEFKSIRSSRVDRYATETNRLID